MSPKYLLLKIINAQKIKSTVMQIEKLLIKYRFHISKVSWNFHIPAIFNFAEIYLWNFLFS